MVPDSFEAFEGAIKQTYDKLVADGKLTPQPDVPPPSVPLDLEAAKKAGKVGYGRPWKVYPGSKIYSWLSSPAGAVIIPDCYSALGTGGMLGLPGQLC